MFKFFRVTAAALLSATVAFSSACEISDKKTENGSQNADADFEQALSNNNKSSQDMISDDVCTVEIGNEVYISSDGANYRSGALSITKGGTYRLSGEINDGYVYINTNDNVKLILDNFSAVNSSGSALYCYNAKNLYIELADGTSNSLEDGASYTFTGENQSAEENEPNATVYSKSDLIFCGNGSLDVKGNYGLGIRCNDDLTIESGNINVTAVTNGIRGTDSLVIEGGVINVNAENDGLKSTNDTDADRGYVLISGGDITITAVEDGIQAEQRLSVTGGNISITTTGNVASGGNDNGWGGKFNFSGGSSADDSTAKGIKSGSGMTISGGNIEINSTDHCIHSAASINISGGEMTLSSSMGKGISAHGNLTVDDGAIDVLNSTEGLESKSVFTVNGGSITVNASDDGLNSGGGSDIFGFDRTDSSEGEHDMFLNGGYIYVNAQGDGIDSNGNITVNGGTIIVNGPVSGMDGALDCGDMKNTVTVNGGLLIAVGSGGMAETPTSGSEQNCLCISTSINAGDTFAVQSSSGENIAVFTVAKQVQHIVLSSPDIKTGETYRFYTGASVEGESVNGLYSNNSAVTVSQEPAAVLTVNSTVTSSSGSVNGGGFGGMGGFGGGGAMGGAKPNDGGFNGGFGGRA